MFGFICMVQEVVNRWQASPEADHRKRPRKQRVGTGRSGKPLVIRGYLQGRFFIQGLLLCWCLLLPAGWSLQLKIASKTTTHHPFGQSGAKELVTFSSTIKPFLCPSICGQYKHVLSIKLDRSIPSARPDLVSSSRIG